MISNRQQPAFEPAPALTPLRKGVLQRKCACGNHTLAGGSCEECRANGGDLQRKSASASEARDVPGIVHDVLTSPGVAMDPATRSFFEPRFGRDLSGIRLHTDGQAGASARAVDALAYTVGRDVVFAPGQYAPHTTVGKQLLAHELAHVIQQGNTSHAAGAALSISHLDSSEAEADGVARDIAAGRPSVALGHAPRSLARQATKAAKKCPATHTIPDDIYKAIGAAWAQSGQAKATVTEHGGRIVTDKAGKQVIRTGAGGGGSISLPAEEVGDVTLGTFHTHPYSKAEGSLLGVSFSGGDIKNFIAGGQGNVKYIGAGTCIYALNTLDATTRDGCKTVDIEKRWSDKFAAASGNFQMKVDTAVRTAIAGCGLCYYGTCSKDTKSAVPKTAKLS
jgi:hypothetical protein